ncbi:MAG: response regulator [Chlorobi bacterium]|nr:response regulator [Chlorobiota bacterium]
MEENEKLKILYVEDSQDDVELTIIQLENKGLSFYYEWAENKEELIERLDKKEWDIVISDFVMPAFNGLEVIEVVKAKDKYLPIIIISGEIGEEVAIETLKAGANDYLMKGNLKRLPSAIKRAIHEKQNEKELQLKTKELTLINALNFAANNGKTLPEIALLFKQKLKKLFSYEDATIYLLSEDKKSLIIQYVGIFEKVRNIIEHLIGFKLNKDEFKLTNTSVYQRIINSKKTNLISNEHEIVQLIKDYSTNRLLPKLAKQIYKILKVKSIITSPLIYNNEVIGLIDITSKIMLNESDKQRIKSLQNEISSIVHRKLTEKQLIKEKKKAEQANELKNKFLANLSHEIRTPMNAIVGFSQMITRDDINTNEKNIFSKHIKNNCDILLANIENIIDISKLQANQLKLSFMDFSIHNTFITLKDKYQTLLKEQNNMNVNITLQTPTNKDVIVRADKIRLYQIIDQLLSNAFRFTEKGAITFGYKFNNSNNLEIFVKDTGKGIQANRLEKIYNVFEKLSPESDVLYPGMGVGLSIINGLLNLMNGTINIHSKLSQGVKIDITIPIIILNENSSKMNNNYLSSDLKTSILLAEDDDASYFLTRRILDKFNMTIMRARNGQEAFDYIKNGNKVDLILMDLRMPVLDGLAATKKIKQINNSLPVFAYSAYCNDIDINAVKNAGCNEYFLKPLKVEEFMNKLYNYLKPIANE